jgi:hypothetical protein
MGRRNPRHYLLVLFPAATPGAALHLVRPGRRENVPRDLAHRHSHRRRNPATEHGGMKTRPS